ncbi:MAG: S53 family peptidase [Sciscionella sp.]
MANGTLAKTHGVKRVCRFCNALVVTSSTGASTPLVTSTPSGYGPSDLAAAYHLGSPGSSTSTDTIAIIDSGVDGNLASDLATYRSQYGLRSCTESNGCLTLENYTGGAQPAPQTSASGRRDEEQTAPETMLDLELASAACPSCHLLELSTPYTDDTSDSANSTGHFATAVKTAVASGAVAISISYGYSANSTNTGGNQLAEMDQKGVSITASTGDSGFNGGTHQEWPSDLPSVTAVGGTSLNKQGSSYSESAWSGAGSGCETYFAKADGQPSSVSADCNNHRAAADVSADADPNTGLAVYTTYTPYSHSGGGWEVYGGTSASSPFIAGLYARGNNLGGVEGPNTLYAASTSAFNDVTSGNNEQHDYCANYRGVDSSVCNAGGGWDGPTGLGSPNGLVAFGG